MGFYSSLVLVLVRLLLGTPLLHKAHLVHEGLEAVRLCGGQLRKHLAVHLDVLTLQSTDELAIFDLRSITNTIQQLSTNSKPKGATKQSKASSRSSPSPHTVLNPR